MGWCSRHNPGFPPRVSGSELLKCAVDGLSDVLPARHVLYVCIVVVLRTIGLEHSPLDSFEEPVHICTLSAMGGYIARDSPDYRLMESFATRVISDLRQD